MKFSNFLQSMDQERIVLITAIVLFLFFSASLDGFATYGNILSMLQNVAIIGALGLGMAVVIIGRGIDLSMVAIMVMPVAWSFLQISAGTSPEEAFAIAGLFAIALGLINGWLIAVVEVPSIFATLATGMILFGTMQYLWVQSDIIQLPESLEWFNVLMTTTLFGIPHTVLFLAGLAFAIWLFLTFTKYGRFIYAVGDNPLAARATGVPVRPILVLQYVLASIVALLAGYVLAATVDSANTRLFYSNIIYDVILVVVLGGVGLGGGRGRVSNVIVGTILIGILINGMTIMNLSYMVQNLIKATVLLLALVTDSLINPRDEQTSQQGDI